MTMHFGGDSEEVVPVMATHVATIGEYGIYGDEQFITIVQGFSYDGVHDLPIDEVPFGYLVLAEPMLLCGASILYNKINREYTAVVTGSVEEFAEDFKELLEAQADNNEQTDL